MHFFDHGTKVSIETFGIENLGKDFVQVRA